MEKDVKSLAAMFEKKTQQPPPVKRKVDPEPQKDVKAMAAMFERKTTVKLD